jgi:TonB family protein
MAREETYKWVQDRLRELHAGNISVDDRQQLLRMAQHDPFIADALEGFESHPHYPHLRTLDTLTMRIQPVKRARRRWLIPNLTVTAVAASLILIVGFWAVMSRINKDDEFAATETSREVVLNNADSNDASIAYEPDASSEQNQSPAGAVSDHKAAIDAGEKQTAKRDVGATRSTEKSMQPAPGKELKKMSTDEAVKKDEVAIAETTPAPATVDISQPKEAMVVQDDARKEAQDPMYFANQMDPDLMARRAAGRVISERGTPLIGANLSIRNTNLGTASDLDGKFELFLPAPESTVDITFSGYEGTSVTLRQGDEDVAILLPEVPVERTYAKTQQAETAGRNAPASAAVNAGTANQQVAYIDYLRNHSRFPLKDNLYTPGRNVTVQFEVTATGEPSHVQVVSSSNNRDLDEEALRLIRKGPVWVCDQDKYPCQIEYTIYFR